MQLYYGANTETIPILLRRTPLLKTLSGGTPITQHHYWRRLAFLALGLGDLNIAEVTGGLKGEEGRRRVDGGGQHCWMVPGIIITSSR